MMKKKGRGNNLARMRSGASLSTESNTYGFIQSRVDVADGVGGVTEGEWTSTTEDPHAFALIPTSSTQVWEDKTVNVKATHIVKMRYEIPVSQLDRIVIDFEGPNERIFEILDIDDIQGRGIVNWIVTKERLD
jgi:hypothetical protein